jgi:hypothetical protein
MQVNMDGAYCVSNRRFIPAIINHQHSFGKLLNYQLRHEFWFLLKVNLFVSVIRPTFSSLREISIPKLLNNSALYHSKEI